MALMYQTTAKLSPFTVDYSLVAGDTNNHADIFVWDNSGAEPTLINLTQGGNDDSYDPTMSDDGGIIAFYSYASNLGSSPDANGSNPDIFVWDRDAATLENITDA